MKSNLSMYHFLGFNEFQMTKKDRVAFASLEKSIYFYHFGIHKILEFSMFSYLAEFKTWLVAYKTKLLFLSLNYYILDNIIRFE